MNAHPFASQATANFGEILAQLKCSLVISTYQAGKVIVIGANDQGQLTQLPRSFDKAMGIATQGQKMAVATRDELVILAASKDMANAYPRKPKHYDTLYLPRATYYTGRVDLHDLEWGQYKGQETLWAVNTSFSCLCTLDHDYSFTPQWQPFFIKQLEHDDFCHLNGMAMDNGNPKYVSLLGQTTTRQGWKDKITHGGVIMDVPNNRIILDGLGMPHSPRLYDGKLYALLSATGELIQIDPENQSYEVALNLGTFVRGLARCGDYLFIGQSALRQSSSTFEKLKAMPIGQNSQYAGISIVHLPSAKKVAEFTYLNSVQEIYDVQVLPNIRQAGILNTQDTTFRQGVSIPSQSYWAASWDNTPSK